MAVRIQLRRDTASNWSTNNPILRPGEVGIETDTLKFKIGPAVVSPAIGTAWNSITSYANVVPSDLNTTLNGYLEVGDIGAISGVVGLNADQDALIPGEAVIFEGATDDSYETKLVVTDPTADRTITLPDVSGTVITTGDTGTVTNTMLAGSIANNKLANSSITINGYEIALGGTAAYGTDNISEGTTNKYFTDERAQDAAAQALANGTHTNITVTYNDNSNAISLAAAPGYTDEEARDAVASLITGSTHSGVSVAYTDSGSSAGELVFTNTDKGSSQNIFKNIVVGATTVVADGNDDTLTFVGSNGVGAIANATNDVIEFYNTGVTSLSGTANQISANSSTGSVTLSLPNAVTMPGSLTVSGNLTVNGTTTTVNTSNFTTSDALIYIGEGNTANSVDLGLVSSFNDGTYQHSGLVRDASDNKWKLFRGVTDEPTTTINFAQATMETLVVGTLEGNVTGNASTVTNGVYTTGSYADPSWITSLSKSKVGLGNVEDTAISTFTGTQNIATLGTVTSGTWNATTIATTKGGTGLTSYATGDVLYASASNTLSKLAAGTEGYLLTMVSGVPAWAAAPISLPSQTSNSGKYLTTDGTSASWATIPVTSDATVTAAGVVFGLTSSSSDNTALGYGPLTNRTTGTYNTAVGKNALLALTSGNANTALGLGALKANTSGADNTALGLEALWSNINGQGNVGVGRNAMQLNSSGSLNIAIGYQSLYRNTSGNNNTVVGNQAAGYITGSQNTVIGATAAYTGSNDITSGSNNIVIGYNAAASAATVSNEITLGDSNITKFRIPGLGIDWSSSTVPGKATTSTLSANTATTVDTVAIAGFTSIEYLVSLKQGTKIRTSKVIVQTDGTSVDMTEFAITETGGTMSGVVVSATTSGSNALLQITVTDAATTNVTAKFTKITI